MFSPENSSLPGKSKPLCPTRVLRNAGVCWSLLLAVSLSSQLGCFNAEAMIESRRLTAIRARLQEVDLGQYQVTMPVGTWHDATTELDFHIFGKVATRETNTVQEVLETVRPEIRDQLLKVTRELSAEELEDPKLTSLRERIAAVINGFLEEELVQSVGFYHFRYSVF